MTLGPRPDLWLPVNRRHARTDRRLMLARAVTSALPWLFFIAAAVIFGDLVLQTALAIHPLAEQAAALKGM